MLNIRMNVKNTLFSLLLELQIFHNIKILIILFCFNLASTQILRKKSFIFHVLSGALRWKNSLNFLKIFFSWWNSMNFHWIFFMNPVKKWLFGPKTWKSNLDYDIKSFQMLYEIIEKSKYWFLKVVVINYRGDMII